jgi:hypothetical protein
MGTGTKNSAAGGQIISAVYVSGGRPMARQIMKASRGFNPGFSTDNQSSRRRRNQERGFAVLVVFILMVLMLGLVIQSGLVLHGLHQELRLVEKRQMKKYPAAMTHTNTVTSLITQKPKLTEHGQNTGH